MEKHLAAVVKVAQLSDSIVNVNSGTALEGTIKLAKQCNVETKIADAQIAETFFKRLNPRGKETGDAKNYTTFTADMLDLPQLNVPTMLDALAYRYKQEIVYSYTGGVRAARKSPAPRARSSAQALHHTPLRFSRARSSTDVISCRDAQT